MSGFNESELTIFTYDDDVKHNMPLIADDNTLAFHLHIRCSTLWYLIQTKKEQYKCFYSKQYDKDGNFKKKRPIQAPLERMKAVHKVMNNMFNRIPVPEQVAAYVPGKNCADTAKKHVGKNILIGMDISNFFNSTKRSYIRNYFKEAIGYSHYVSSILADLCCYEDFLPQGSPLSGYLANLVAWHRFGNKIQKYLDTERPGWVFTIYSDDITLSHSEDVTQEDAKKVISKINQIVKDAGYKVNLKKTRILRKGSQQRVLGCVVNEKLNIPRNTYNRIRCLIHNCLHKGFDSQAERCGKKSGEAVATYITGMLSYFKQIRPDRWETLNNKFHEAVAVHEKEGAI